MACLLTQGYTFTGCKGGISGIDEVRITEFDNVTAYTLTAGVITAITMSGVTKFRKYILDKEMGMDSDDLTFTPGTGTITYAHKVDFTIKGQTTSVKNELALVAQNVLMIMTKRRNGTYWMFGITKGMDLVTATSGTSKESAGFTGHNLSFIGLEPAFAYEVDASIVAAITA
jgi:hypothetical protein